MPLQGSDCGQSVYNPTVSEYYSGMALSCPKDHAKKIDWRVQTHTFLTRALHGEEIFGFIHRLLSSP
jgi:hypothetical protein